MDTPKKRAKCLRFTGDCSIYEVDSLKLKLLDALDKNQKINLRLTKIERVDASFIQLLLSAKAEAQSRNISLNLIEISQRVLDFATKMQAVEPLIGLLDEEVS